ncbi:TetR/AcrR family transcriptional regulator [Streptomyces fulvoviolaceus]|uniref:TetR/AcrR family transcriptional regulator n=1 Tax=Streptomyces fulvoviolaceus TaxID=285535 RepID=UPI0021C0836B|nr:TetR/AcrR family transcriptional regulator [Streptomyces fulvoviolaceus]MCT9077468.1 TetR/AcrR family transcriptional regulator [Streptomyces fulvoviolaceus]
MAGRTRRDEQVRATREALLDAAERLFAEHGVYAVANRQISEAAGQGNNTAVSYHFGAKAELVRAIVRRHAEQIEVIRVPMLDAIGDSSDLRDWVDCSVRPVTEHLEALGCPSWYARFIAQVSADPALYAITEDEFYGASPSLGKLEEGLTRCVPGLPAEVRAERAVMTRHLIVQMSVERERALADHTPAPRSTWHDAATGLVDAIVALWQAPVTREEW